MKKVLLLSVILSTLFIPFLVAADGAIFIPDYAEYVYSPSQKAAIIWDGSKETIILSVKMTMDRPENLAWVVPLPSSSKPEIAEGDGEIFYEIMRLLSPPPKSGDWGSFIHGMSGNLQGSEGVEVLEEKKIDIYDIAILRATDADVLVDWLNKNGYSIPDKAIPTLQHYADQNDFYFIANKVNVSNKYAGMSFTDNDISCADAFVDEKMPWYWYDIGYAERYIEDNIDYICDNASAEAVKVLYQLKSGIATPLKMEFEPGEPFYPMKMTSINPGIINVKVYIFSNSYLKDSSGLMKTDKMTQANPALSESLGLVNENFLTALTFDDDTSKMTEDSVFEPVAYEPLKDPYYVSPQEMLMNAVLFMTMLLFYAGMMIYYIAAPAFLLGLGAGFLGRRLENKRKNKNLRYVPLIILIIAEAILTLLFPHLRPVLLEFIMPFICINLFGFYSVGWKRGPLKWIAAAVAVSLAMLVLFWLLSFSYSFIFY